MPLLLNDKKQLTFASYKGELHTQLSCHCQGKGSFVNASSFLHVPPEVSWFAVELSTLVDHSWHAHPRHAN